MVNIWQVVYIMAENKSPEGIHFALLIYTTNTKIGHAVGVHIAIIILRRWAF
jgi:hypothetical protein